MSINPRMNPYRALAHDVHDRIQAYLDTIQEKIPEFMEEEDGIDHIYYGDYKIPCTLRHILKESQYEDRSNILLGHLRKIRSLNHFKTKMVWYYDPDKEYGVYDQGDRYVRRPSLSLFYHLETLYSRIFTSTGLKEMMYCLRMHYAICFSDTIRRDMIMIIANYFNSLTDPLVRKVILRGFMPAFILKLVKIHFVEIDEEDKMKNMMNNLFGSYNNHWGWVISHIIETAFNMKTLTQYYFTDDSIRDQYLQIYNDHLDLITSPNDAIINSLMESVVLSIDLGLDDFTMDLLDDVFPRKMDDFKLTHEKSGLGISFLQKWMELLHERLLISTMRSDLTELA